MSAAPSPGPRTPAQIEASRLNGARSRGPKTAEGRAIADQIVRSGTAVGANYRAACKARSRAEFLSKLGTVEEEADETLFWLELLEEAGIVSPQALQQLRRECDELTAIFVTILKRAKSSQSAS